MVISFYTRDTFYQLEVQGLIESCEKYGVECCVKGIATLGSWELNCAYKPFFIHEQLQIHKRPLLWVDADAVFLRKPEVLPVFNADLAVRINEDLSVDHPSRVMSGTVYANYTPGADRWIRAWAQKCHEELLRPGREAEYWDQMALRDVVASGEGIVALPREYATIADHWKDCAEIQSPVIVHHQASRRHRSIQSS